MEPLPLSEKTPMREDVFRENTVCFRREPEFLTSSDDHLGRLEFGERGIELFESNDGMVDVVSRANHLLDSGGSFLTRQADRVKQPRVCSAKRNLSPWHARKV